MRYCLRCKYEFDDDTSICPDCQGELVDHRPEDEPAPVVYVFLKDVPSRLYAEMLTEALANNGIRAIIKSDDIGIMLGSFGTTSPVKVEVWVESDKLEEAQDIAHQILDHF